jgi:toxin-antitoxin system PIN domain toxin
VAALVAALMDVNALIALVDADHTGHSAMHKWFAAHAGRGWATCPLVENGMVRVLSQPGYRGGRRTPAAVIALLRALKASAHHEFWRDDVSLSDETLFDPAYIIGARQVTDVYLLGLAARRGGRVVSFDRSMPWQAIRNGSQDLLESPE